MSSQRLTALDGLRGVAIALVVLYHAYVRWPAFVPYGDHFAATPVLAHGKVGVQLFFLISGFVIFMSLEKSKGFGDFLLRRWLRLFPAMLAVSLFVFATAPLFVRPQGDPAWRDLLPGLTFIAPDWWSALLGPPQGELEGAFWSLYVEVKFYVVAGLCYAAFGSTATIAMLVAVFFAPFVAGRFAFAPAVYAVVDALGAWHWGWFAAGALYYKVQRGAPRCWLLAAAGLSVFAAFKLERPYVLPGLAVAALFAAAQVSARLREALSWRPLLVAGAISYPLYLVHENVMVALIGSLGRALPWLPDATLPVLPMAAVVALGWVFARWVEPMTRDLLVRAFLALRAALR